jgi:nitrogen PTS system EIIA component
VAVNKKKSLETLNLIEIAKYLNVSENTITQLVANGKIPARRESGQWQFIRSVVDDWLETRIQTASNQKLTEIITTIEQIIPLSQLVSSERIIVNLNPGSKSEILEQLVQPLLKTGMIDESNGYLKKLAEREAMLSTAIGNHVAFPHVRRPDESRVVAPCVVLGICPDGVDFASLDGAPTYVFALCCGNSETTHLRLLAKVTLFLRKDGIVNSLRKHETPEAIMRELVRADCQLTASF